MKSKNQGNSPIEIVDVENISIAVINGKEILIHKPRCERAIAYRLPNNFVQKLIESREQNRKSAN